MVFYRKGKTAVCSALWVAAAVAWRGTLAFAPLAYNNNNVQSSHRAAHHSFSKLLESRSTGENAVPVEGPLVNSNEKDHETIGLHKAAASKQQPILARAIRDSAVSLAAAAMILSSTGPADAAMSGGRMGGSFSAPRSSGGSSSMRLAPSRGYSGGGGNFYAAPRTTIVTPYVSPFYSPFSSPIVPFYGGGVGAISYNRGPGLFDMLFLGGLGWFAISTVTGAMSKRSSSALWSDDDSGTRTTSVLGSGTSVVRLSVALDVSNRDDPNSILSVLDRLSATANTDNRRGVQTLTSQVALEILRRKSAIQSAAGAYEHYNQDSTAQRTFNKWSVQERSKFEQETVSKYGGVDLSPSSISSGSGSIGSKATMVVVTLVLSIQGDSTKVPTKIGSLADVEDALRKIAADVKVDDCLTGAEILWTPQDRSEVLTRKDIVADYPELTAV
jgi:uncharacterized membrane protein